jgi:hypothetical protein
MALQIYKYLSYYNNFLLNFEFLNSQNGLWQEIAEKVPQNFKKSRKKFRSFEKQCFGIGG